MISHARSSSQICRQHLVSPQPSNLQREQEHQLLFQIDLNFVLKFISSYANRHFSSLRKETSLFTISFLSTLVKLHSHSHHTEHSGEMEFFSPRSIKSSKLKLTFNKLFFYVYGLVPPCFKKASLFHTYLQQSNCYISYTFSRI